MSYKSNAAYIEKQHNTNKLSDIADFKCTFLELKVNHNCICNTDAKRTNE